MSFIYLLYLICIIPLFIGIGAASLLLKLLQIKHVLEKYITEWVFADVVHFLGFANNVAGMSVSEPIQIASFQRVLFLAVEEEAVNNENVDRSSTFGRVLEMSAKVANSCELMQLRFNVETARAIMKKKGISVFTAWMILNSWALDPDTYIKLLCAKSSA